MALDGELALEPAAAIDQALVAVARDRSRFLGALLVQALCGLAQPPAPAPGAGDELGSSSPRDSSGSAVSMVSVAIASETIARAICS